MSHSQKLSKISAIPVYPDLSCAQDLSLLFEDNEEDEEYGEDFEEALAQAAQDRYYNVEARQATGSSLYLACRLGDLERVRYVLED